MLSLFRRKPEPVPQTFNERVAAFWSWFQEVAPHYYATIEAGKCASLADETSANVDLLGKGFAWVYGPGEGGKGHSLTVCGEGYIHAQLLALQWLKFAPKIEGWTFYAARQPGPIRGHVIEMYNLRFDPKEIWVTTVLDEHQEKFDIYVWHHAWEGLEERKKFGILFLFLDEALGEYGTGRWIGEIKLSKDRLAQSFPLEELADRVNKSASERKWKLHAPGEIWTILKINRVEGTYPRSDLTTLSTAVPKLLHQYMESEGELADPLAGTGADYVYASIEKDFFPEGNEVARRGQIEDAIESALAPIQGGRIVSGGFGTERGYIDVLVFDGRRSLELMRRALVEQRVPRGTMIEFFAREKRGQRIAA